MMDYTAGSGRHGISEASPIASQIPTTPVSAIRARTYAATGGSAGMNITTGGPHLVLFERDQQLVGLLTSELQLAGYECHTARTAVEVFDAIARFPVKLVLVNLAQAAAARREFWVALDTQRRGRGVQVLTFHCTNLAGYGPASDDGEERSPAVLADVEIDGMMGVMNMVSTIRSRIVVSNNSTISRAPANANTTSAFGSQATVPIPSLSSTPGSQQPRGATSAAGAPIIPAQVAPPSMPIPPGASVPQQELPRTVPPGHTDKIRAVMYPNQRSWSTARDTNLGSGQNAPAKEPSAQEAAWLAQQYTPPAAPPPAVPPTPLVDAFHNGQKRSMSDPGLPKESGLAQLSRMLQEHQEHHSPLLEETPSDSPERQADALQEDAAFQPRIRANDAPPISAMHLRASPIQDMPTDRSSSGISSDTAPQTVIKRVDEAVWQQNIQVPSSPTLLSIATPAPQVVPPTPVQVSYPTYVPSTPEEIVAEPPHIAPEEPRQGERPGPTSAEEPGNTINASTVIAEEADLAPVAMSVYEPTRNTPDNALLLDIVQSLPSMVSPPPQPHVHNGRATRSLGSVLVEGHLVPQNRLEVAQGIQRLLRGVDMNYQLGEILLMFKLLSPDQLLAASLVSCGLITAAQISALGRIRQELHSIGLEYDLENLLILFRILTSEQLREVRANWSS